MVIKHNMQALQSENILNNTTKKVGKSAEKLSTGYKINRASDDAAGLVISEKMRNQVRGLNQASENMQDGESMIQVADGAMGEVTSMLQRISELCVKSANDTNGEEDRDAIQGEVDQLISEIDNIAKKTQFNGIPILQGDGGLLVDGVEGDLPMSVLGAPGTTTPLVGLTDTASIGTPLPAGERNASYLDFSNVDSNNVGDLVGQGFYLDAEDGKYSIKFVDSGASSMDPPTPANNNTTIFNVDVSSIAAGVDDDVPGLLVTAIQGLLSQSANFCTDLNTNQTMQMAELGNFMAMAEEMDKNGNPTGRLTVFNKDGSGDGDARIRTGTYTGIKRDLVGDRNIQSSANSGNSVVLNMPNTSTEALGIAKPRIDVSTYESSNVSLDYIQNAINIISGQRSSLGAAYNRLEHSISNVDNTSENTQAAESRIRDVDMAEEMVEYSKQNILMQAGQSMLAQANQNPQGVVTLLQA